MCADPKKRNELLLGLEHVEEENKEVPSRSLKMVEGVTGIRSHSERMVRSCSGSCMMWLPAVSHLPSRFIASGVIFLAAK